MEGARAVNIGGGATTRCVYLDRSAWLGTVLELDMFAARVPCRVVPDVSLDPRGKRMAD